MTFIPTERRVARDTQKTTDGACIVGVVNGNCSGTNPNSSPANSAPVVLDCEHGLEHRRGETVTAPTRPIRFWFVLRSAYSGGPAPLERGKHKLASLGVAVPSSSVGFANSIFVLLRQAARPGGQSCSTLNANLTPSLWRKMLESHNSIISPLPTEGVSVMSSI